MTADACRCSGHGNEPNPCPECEAYQRLAEKVADELGKGKLDWALGEFALAREGRVVVRDLLGNTRGSQVRLRPGGGLEWDTVASKWGWRRPAEFVPVRLETIGEVYREIGDPLVEEFAESEIERRMELPVSCPEEVSA